jgi:DHA2 family multidrug resistance protein
MSDSASPSVNVPHRGIITISIMLATLIHSLDSKIANVALPHLQGSLSASHECQVDKTRTAMKRFSEGKTTWTNGLSMHWY